MEGAATERIEASIKSCLLSARRLLQRPVAFPSSQSSSQPPSSMSDSDEGTRYSQPRPHAVSRDPRLVLLLCMLAV